METDRFESHKHRGLHLWAELIQSFSLMFVFMLLHDQHKLSAQCSRYIYTHRVSHCVYVILSDHNNPSVVRN